MNIRTVGELREALARFPDYRPLVVEVTVGGDLITDVVDLLELAEATEKHAGTYVILRPSTDEYDVRALIDDGLLLRAMREEGGKLASLIGDRLDR